MQFNLFSGGFVCWDGCAPNSITESSKLITHQIVDRNIEMTDINRWLAFIFLIFRSSRIYVQPQWVFDCFNSRRILPTVRYAPSATLPPHLSPFVEDEHETRGYVPEEMISHANKDPALISNRKPEVKKARRIDHLETMLVQKSKVYKESLQKKINEEVNRERRTEPSIRKTNLLPF